MRSALLLVTCTPLVALIGCSSHPDASSRSRPATVTAHDFANHSLAAVNWTPEPAPRRPVPVEVPKDDVLDITARPGAPSLPEGTPALLPDLYTVDSKVGDINGHPLYASQILGELDGRLRALATEVKDNRKWMSAAATLIHDEIGKKVRDELILAEARQALTPQQKEGLLYFMEVIREDFVSGEGGSRAKAEERLLESSGQTLDQSVRDRLDRALIDKEIKDRIISRVNVSWRDVEIEYERNAAKYNPAAVAVLRMIVVPTADAEAVSEVTRRLEAGDKFALVAASPLNRYNVGEAGLEKKEFRGDFAAPENSYFGPPELDAAVRTLSPGGTTSPVKFLQNTAWIHYEKVERAPAKSLFEVQLEIYNELRQRRLGEEEQRYFARLLATGSFSDVQSMTEQLLQIAAERYLKPSR